MSDDGETAAVYLERCERGDREAFTAGMSRMLDGKSIAGWEAEHRQYSHPWEVVLRFTDGTAVKFTAAGYETDGVCVGECS